MKRLTSEGFGYVKSHNWESPCRKVKDCLGKLDGNKCTNGEKCKKAIHTCTLKLAKEEEPKSVKPLREHFEIDTDAGICLETFRYIDALEKYIEQIEKK
jgi:hypothetical protein